MLGENLSKDYNPYWGIEAADWCQRLNAKTIPRFNAGVFIAKSQKKQKLYLRKQEELWIHMILGAFAPFQGGRRLMNLASP